MNKENNLKEAQLKESNEKNSNPNSLKSRRGFIAGLFIGGATVASVLGKSQKSYADSLGGDTAILNDISFWLKTTWTTQILPLIKMLKEWYDTVKSWINTWNNFVTEFNHGMRFVEDLRNFATQKQDNWFYQSFVQLKEYINTLMHTDGDILKYRLHYYEPILIQKIDSMMFEFDNLVNRAHAVARSYVKLGAKPGLEDAAKQTKEGKLAVRASTDHAKYLESQARILSLKQTTDKIKENIPNLMRTNPSPENSAKIYHDLIAPQMLEAEYLQCSILSEIYAKLNDLFLMAAKEEPIISTTENIVKKEDFKAVLRDLSLGNKKGFLI